MYGRIKSSLTDACTRVNASRLVQLSVKALILLMLPIILICDITHRFSGTVSALMLMCGALALLMALLIKRFPKTREAVLAAAYAAWLLATRFFAEGQSVLEAISRLGYVTFGAFVCFLIAQALHGEENVKRFRVLAEAATALVPCLIAAVSFAVLVLDCDISLGSTCLSECIVTEGGRMKFFGMHYNTVATLYTVGIAAAIMRIFDTKRLTVRIGYAIVVAICFCGLVLTDTRTCMLISFVTIGVAAALAVFDLIKNVSIGGKALIIPKAAVCAVLALLIAFGCLKLTPKMSFQFNMWNHNLTDYKLLSAMAEEQSDTEEGAAAEAVSEAELPSASGSGAIHDKDNWVDLASRGYDDASQLLSLNGRTQLYGMLLDELLHSPRTMLLGSARDGSGPFAYTSESGVTMHWNHMHSSYFSVMFETGIIGMLLTAAFIILMVIRMAKLFFAPANRLSAGERFQVLLPAGLMVISVVEPIMFSALSTRGIYSYFHLLCMLWCGFIAERSMSLEKEAGTACRRTDEV